MSNMDLFNEALLWLSSEDAQSAPLDRIVQFLQSKGLTRDAILSALKLSNVPASPEQVDAVLGGGGRSSFEVVATVACIVGLAWALKTYCPFRLAWPSPAPRHWYDAHREVDQDEEEVVVSELDRLRQENAAMRSELATLRGSHRQLHRKLDQLERTKPTLTHEDLLRPVTRVEPPTEVAGLQALTASPETSDAPDTSVVDPSAALATTETADATDALVEGPSAAPATTESADATDALLWSLGLRPPTQLLPDPAPCTPKMPNE
eukprot:NODE_4040_length_851_cov_45.204420_g3883_i0.p1 GENE.NODE_4040_length_851_cov_45.204420_g3883_i0~~NODE_4040_length_851_cov_45.204420_g3883_i0.p1  ORF type:complete len:273 (+),score=66.24 NODE_4040_length_851_cov_45.204420_g3883_i0:29-820(+)